MDTNLGKLNISSDQIQNIVFLVKPEPFTGFGFFEDGSVVASSIQEPTEEQKTAVIVWLQALPTTVETNSGLAIQRFDFKKLWGVVWAGALSATGLVNIPPYSKTIEDMWNYPNRAAVYPFMQALVSAGKGTAGDLAIIVAAFADQNIDITTIQ